MNAEVYHVIPVDDLREHVPQRDCWCHPTWTETGVIAHHALDNREAYEELHPGMLRLQ